MAIKYWLITTDVLSFHHAGTLRLAHKTATTSSIFPGPDLLILDFFLILTSVTFSRHGCIYYQSDLESRPERPTFTSIPNQESNRQSAQPTKNFQRSQEQPETPEDYISLLKRYIEVAPLLVQYPSGIKYTNRLLHSGLHLETFVEP
ncbi:hypothetical protein BDV12DRAFT_50348 [Aspergillus spectabilis]